jgi:5-methylcytosine-specific restriction endonuclease McrA
MREIVGRFSVRVRKIGQLNEGSELSGRYIGTVASILTNNQFDLDVETTTLTLPLIIGKGLAARELRLEIVVETEALVAQQVSPTSLAAAAPFACRDREYVGVFLFRDQVFEAVADYLEGTSEEEASLLIKKQALSDDSRLKRLRQEVETLERVVNTVGVKRIAIPEAIKLLVYSRDEGKCVRCDSSEQLHFDHIIPVAKGGGNSENNIQLLCDYCNLQKSDKIAF